MGDSLRATIADLNVDGRGLAFLGRKKAFISQTLPGEEVVFEIDRKTRTEMAGRVKRFIHKSTQRIEHDCMHEFHCTGCPLLASEPSFESDFKANKIRSILEDVGIAMQSVNFELRRPSKLFGYRHYAKQVFGLVSGRVVLGSYVAGTHELADNEHCPVLTHDLQCLLSDLLQEVRRRKLRVHWQNGNGIRFAVARQSRDNGEILLVLSTSDEKQIHEIGEISRLLLENNSILQSILVLHNDSLGNSLLTGDELLRFGNLELSDSLLGFDFKIGPRSFFQINPSAAEVLFETALAYAGEGKRCLELFAGVGALTFGLGARFEQVRAVELVAEAVASLNRRKTHLGMSGISAFCGDATSLGAELLERFIPEVCVADPPRKGLGRKLTKSIGESSVKRLVLLSCEPQSLRRDLPDLLQAGFKASSVCAVDQFPRTAHVETVILLER